MTRFFLIAFAITWTCQLAIVGLSIDQGSGLGLALLLISGFGPTIAAFLCGRPSPGNSPEILVLLLALALPSLIRLLAGGHPGAPDLVAALLPPVGEEPGWRGYAQDRMVARFGRPLGFLCLGLIWSVWHLPTAFLSGGHIEAFPGFLAQTTLVSIWISWTYEKAGLWAAILAHAGMNLSLVEGHSTVVAYFAWAAIALGILVSRGPEKKVRRDRSPPAVQPPE